MQLHIGILRSELERQRKALTREMDLMQKESTQLVKKGNQIQQTIQLMRDLSHFGQKKTSPYVFKYILSSSILLHTSGSHPHTSAIRQHSLPNLCVRLNAL